MNFGILVDHSPMSVLTYGALDKVNYENLDKRAKKDSADPAGNLLKNSVHHVLSLETIAAQGFIRNNKLLDMALDAVPCHLMDRLLRAAILSKGYYSASVLISEWPQETLNLRSVWPEGKATLFGKKVEFGAAVLMGLLRRELVKPKVKLTCLDLQGFEIDEIFSRVLIGSLPILAIPIDKRNVDDLVGKLMEFLAVEGGGERVIGETDSLEEDLRPILQAKIDLFKDGYIYVPPGEKFVVKMDRLDFERSSVKYMEYLIMGALRNMTPYRVEAYNLYVYTDVKENERIIDSCAPFLALLGQDPQVLYGLSLNNMEDMLFQYILRGLAPFTKLRALDIGDCSISVSGRTRVRTALRNRIVGLFSSFSDLCRLDLNRSDLCGNLSDLLDALPRPLEYLNLSSCCLQEADLNYLSLCKHTASMKELHLSSLVELGEIDSPEQVLHCVRGFTNNLTVLELQNNEIADVHIDDLCSVLSQFKALKLMDTTYNFLSEKSLWRLVEAAANCPTMQCLAINNLPIFGNAQDVLDRRLAIQMKCKEVLQQCCRTDLSIVVALIGIE